MVVDDYGSQRALMNNASLISTVSKLGDAIRQADRAFTKANNGQSASSPDQLLPFFAAPVDDTALREYWETSKR